VVEDGGLARWCIYGELTDANESERMGETGPPGCSPRGEAHGGALVGGDATAVAMATRLGLGF
jgi:hypothetical protein